MKSKTKKSDRKSTASRGQGSTQHRLTSDIRTLSPPHDTTLSTAGITSDASPLSDGHSLTVRIAAKNTGRKSCDPTGLLLQEGPEITGSGSIETSLVLVGDAETAPEAVEGPEMKQTFKDVEGPGNSHHQIPPAKRMKMMSRETQPSSSSSSSAERCNAGVLTDPDCLGPCDPGSSVILEGIVWNESRNGLLVVNVTWRGKTYVGTLMDSTNHHWASPSFKEDSLSNDNSLLSRDEDGVAMVPEGRRLRRCRTTQPSSSVMATASTASSSSASTTSTSSRTSTSRTKCRVPVGDHSVQTDPVNLQLILNGNGSDAGVLCPELHCQRKFKHEAALRNHRFRAHKATDLIAMSAFATSSAAAAAASAARSIVNDSGGNPSTAQGKGPSLLLPAKQRSFDDEEDVSSVNGGRVIKKSEDGARLCMEKDDESLEAEFALIKSASWMENDKLNCFVPFCCLQSTSVACTGSVELSCAKLPMSTKLERGAADATLDSSSCQVSEGAGLVCDSVERITVCADKQKMRNGAKKKCRGKPDRIQRNLETVVSSTGSTSQTFGQSLTAACAVAEHGTAGAVVLQGSEDKHSAKRLKTNGGIPLSMLSVSLSRIPMENDLSLPRKTVSATETRSDDRLQDAEKNGSFCTTGVDSSVRGLRLDVAKLCLVSGYDSCAGREPSAAETPSQSFLAVREMMMGRSHSEKTQVDSSNCHSAVAQKAGNMHDDEIAKPLLESGLLLPGKGQHGSDSKTCSDRSLSPSMQIFRSSKTCHEKVVAPGIVCNENQKLGVPNSGSSLMFAADTSKSLLDHIGKELMPGCHLTFMEKRKQESTNSAKGIQNSTFCLRTSTVENIGNQAFKQKCPSQPNLDQALSDRSTATSAAPPGGTALLGSGPIPYTKDTVCDLKSFTKVQKDFSDLSKGLLPSRSTIPFAVPPGCRSVPNGSLTWTTSPFISSISSLQHPTISNTSSSDPQAGRGSTYVTALASSMSSSTTQDCSFVPFCRAIQGAPGTTSLPKQMNKSCVPSPPLASCPLEANTASEVFVRRDDGSWTSATVGKSVQQMISNSSCTERSLLACGAVSLPVPLQPPSASSSPSTDLHHGVIPYQQKKEKLLSTLHSSAMKPPSSSSRSSLLAGHSVQTACPK